MKKISLLLIITLCHFAWAQEYFIKNFSNSSTRTQSLITTSDSCYLMAGVDDSNNMFAFKTDQFGDTLWLRTYGGNQADEIIDLVEIAGGNILLAGNTSSFGSGGTDICLTQINPQGTVVWSKTIGSTNDDKVYAIIATNDGGFLLSGKGSSNNADAWLVKMDNSGAVQWEYTYSNMNMTMGNNVVQTNDGGYAIVGKSGSNLKMIRLDSGGTYLWAREVSAQLQVSVNGFGILELSNGNLVIYGDEQAARINIFIMSITPTGDYIWGSVFRQNPSSFDYAHSALETADGGVVLSTVFEQNLGMLKLSSNGQLDWAYYYIGPETSSTNYDYKGHLALNLSGGYTLNSNDESAIVSTDSLGQVPCYSFQPETLTTTTNSNLTTSSSSAVPSTSVVLDITTLVIGGHTMNLVENSLLPSVTAITFPDDCTGIGSATLSASGGTAPYNAVWSTSCTGLACSNLFSGDYNVLITDNAGCSAQVVVTIPHSSTTNEICQVSVDSSSQYVYVRWDKVTAGHIEGFNIYREQNGSFSLVGYSDYNASSIFLDQSAGINPNQFSHNYRLTVVDTCGYESDMSGIHQTIRCAVDNVTANSTYIAWSDYEPAGLLNGFNIYRDSLSNGDWELIDNVSSSTLNYLDPFYLQTCRYRVEGVFSASCTIDGSAYQTSLSNSASVQEVGLNENEITFSLYPNPTSDQLILRLDNDFGASLVTITDFTGRVVFTQQINSFVTTIDVRNLSTGTYFLTLENDFFKTAQKFTKQP